MAGKVTIVVPRSKRGLIEDAREIEFVDEARGDSKGVFERSPKTFQR